MEAIKNALLAYKDSHPTPCNEFEKGFLEGLNQAISIINDDIEYIKQEEDLTEEQE